MVRRQGHTSTCAASSVSGAFPDVASYIVLLTLRPLLLLTPLPPCPTLRKPTIVATVGILHFTGHDPRSHDLMKDLYIWFAGSTWTLDYCPQLANPFPATANRYLSSPLLLQSSFSLLIPTATLSLQTLQAREPNLA